MLWFECACSSLISTCCCELTRLPLRKKETHQTLMNATLPAAPLICISVSGTDFQLWLLQKRLKHANARQLNSASFKPARLCDVLHKHYTRKNILPCYSDNTVRATNTALSQHVLRADYLPPKQFTIFLLRVCGERRLNSQCQFHAHNAPWEYIFHVPWMLITLRNKTQAWNDISGYHFSN